MIEFLKYNKFFFKIFPYLKLPPRDENTGLGAKIESQEYDNTEG